MPRLVRFTHGGPIKIEPSDKPIFVCACGLSQKFPLCDGSHKACKVTEAEAGKLFVYDIDRRTIVETRDEPPSAAGPETPALPPAGT